MSENLIKKDYILSIWLEERQPDADINSPSYAYKEKEFMIIGTDKDESPVRAFNPVLKRDANGNKTLTFEMFLRYFDEDLGETIENPFCQYLKSETHIKLKTKEKWYDFVIKDIDEDSNTRKVSYTANDFFVNELSKNGYALTFDIDHRNNTGTARALAEKALEDTDWKVSDKSEVLKQTIDQPLFMAHFSAPVAVQLIEKAKSNLKSVTSVSSEDSPSYQDAIEMGKSSVVYVKDCFIFYKDFAQRFVLDDAEFLTHLTVQDSTADLQVIIPTIGNGDGSNGDNAYTFLEENGELKIEFQEETFIYGTQGIIGHGNLNNARIESVSFITDYRAKELVKSDNFIYDPVTDRCVKEYTHKENDVDVHYYGFEKTTEEAPQLVNNLLPYSGDFTSTLGWSLEPDASRSLKVTLNGQGNKSILSFAATSGARLTNDLTNNRSGFGGLQVNDVFYLRLKFTAPESPLEVISSIAIKNGSNVLVNFPTKLATSTQPFKDTDSYYWFKGVCATAVAEKILDEANDLAFEIRFTTGQNTNYGIEDFQLFRESRVSTTVNTKKTYYLIAPTGYLELPNWKWQPQNYTSSPCKFFKYGDKSDWALNPNNNSYTFAPDAIVTTKFYFYKKPALNADAEEITYQIYDSIPYDFVPVKSSSDPYEKIKSIEQSETNRMDILTKICETFQCWLDFDITRDETTGEIKGKAILFKQYLNKEKYYGFSYGLNLKSVKRSVDSNQIATKIFVKPNSNEYAPNGSCTIAEASDNPTGGELFFYNFDYYINNGMLDKDTVTKDVFLGLYPKIRSLNYQAKAFNQKIVSYSQVLDEIESSCIATEAIVNDSEKQIEHYDNTLQISTRNIDSPGYSTGLSWQDCREDSRIWNLAISLGAESFLIQLSNLQQKHDAAEQQLPSLRKQRDDYRKEIKSLTRKLESQKKEINELIKTFEKGYIRFIQEGAWTSDDYVDPNLYYYDAEATLYESSRPKVEYTFDTVDISVLDDFGDYQFDVGDKTWVEDTEFFGWVYDKFSTKIRPYREEVVVYEYEENLDDPRNDKITIKTFKSQFEDLFQRIGNTVNQLEFKSGSYNRIAGLVNSNGTITNAALENSFLENAAIVQNGINQAVTKGPNGVTITSTSSPNEIVRLVSGGIVLSEDGGKTWRTGITGHGVSADKITAGTINTSEITLMNGTDTSFSWTSDGIKAFGANGYSRYSNQGLEIFKNTDDGQERVFYTDEEGNLNISGRGQIHVQNGGQIGGWNISSSQLVYQGPLDGNGHDVMGVFQPMGYLLSAGEETKKWYQESQFGKYLSERWVDQVLFQVGGNENGFVVTPGGKVFATSGHFSGEITATSGTIGGWTITSNEIGKGDGNTYLRPNATGSDLLFKIGNNFSVDANGNIRATGGTIGGVNIQNQQLQLGQGLYISDGKLSVNTLEVGELTVDKNQIIGGVVDSLGGGTFGGWHFNSEQMWSTPNNVILNGETGTLTLKGDLIINGTIKNQNGELGANVADNFLSYSDNRKNYQGGLLFTNYSNESAVLKLALSGASRDDFATSGNSMYFPNKISTGIVVNSNGSGHYTEISSYNSYKDFARMYIGTAYCSGEENVGEDMGAIRGILYGYTSATSQGRRRNARWYYLGGENYQNSESPWTSLSVSTLNQYEIAVKRDTNSSSSDIRLKENISPLINSDDLFDSVSPVTFNFKENTKEADGSKIHFGFIAQNFQEALQKSKLPLDKLFLISEGQDGYLRLAYQELIALLWDQVQKLRKRVALLEKPREV